MMRRMSLSASRRQSTSSRAALPSPASALNPFGSFCHDGSLPDSMFSQPYVRGSDALYLRQQAATPPSSVSSSLQETSNTSSTPQVRADSTHLYINLMDQSGQHKSTKFWMECESSSEDDDYHNNTESNSNDSSSDDGDASILDEHRCDVASVLDDHRGDLDSADMLDFTLESRPCCIGQEMTPSLIMAPVLHSRPRHSEVFSKVGAWLSGLEGTSPTSSSSSKTSSSRSPSSVFRSDPGTVRPQYPYNTPVDRSPVSRDNSQMTTHNTSSSDSLKEDKLHVSLNTSVTHSIPQSETSQCPSNTNQQQATDSQRSTSRLENTSASHSLLDSDMSYFMDCPLARTGVTGRKLTVSKRRLMTQKLKRMARHFHRSKQEDIQTLAVL